VIQAIPTNGNYMDKQGLTVHQRNRVAMGTEGYMLFLHEGGRKIHNSTEIYTSAA